MKEQLMTYEDALAHIHSLNRFGSHPGLERISALLKLMGNPQRSLRFVHVAGTNGKGSVSAMTAGILRCAGYRTGLYISPFVLDFCERMQVDGEMISKDELLALTREARQLSRKVKEITEFEFVTAVAFAWFAARECDVVVLETGLGGRLDATNVVESTMVAAITSISLDHMEVLGGTIEKIAGEKCGIIKPGAHVVTCPDQDLQALSVIRRRCSETGCSLFQPDISEAQNVRADVFGTDAYYKGYGLSLQLAGLHQLSNALTAIAVVEILRERFGFDRIDKYTIEQGLAGVTFPARMEILRRSPLVILDGAHNPSGAKALSDTLKMLGSRPICAVMGMLADKNIKEVLRTLVPHFERMYCVTPDNPRALPAYDLAQHALALDARHAQEMRGLLEAYETAAEYAAGRDGGVVLICGSLYLASEIRPLVLLSGQSAEES